MNIKAKNISLLIILFCLAFISGCSDNKSQEIADKVQNNEKRTDETTSKTTNDNETTETTDRVIEETTTVTNNVANEANDTTTVETNYIVQPSDSNHNTSGSNKGTTSNNTNNTQNQNDNEETTKNSNNTNPMLDLYFQLGFAFNSDGYLFIDNTSIVKSSGAAVAENMDEFYNIVENAVRNSKHNITVYLNIYNIDVVANKLYRDIYPSDAKKSNGEYYYVEDRIICDERPFADYERIVNTTGINVLWNPGYIPYLDWDVKYVRFDMTFTYLSDDTLYFAHSNDELTKKINEAISKGEKRINVCRYFRTEDPDTVEQSDECRKYLYNLYQKDLNGYYGGYHILDIDYSNRETIALSINNSGESSLRWNEIYFNYTPVDYDGYQNFGCVYYLTFELGNIKDDLENREGLTEITSLEQLTQIREEKRAEGEGLGNCWLGYFRGSYEEAFDYHTQMVLNGNPVNYEKIADGWYIFYWKF